MADRLSQRDGNRQCLFTFVGRLDQGYRVQRTVRHGLFDRRAILRPPVGGFGWTQSLIDQP